MTAGAPSRIRADGVENILCVSIGSEPNCELPHVMEPVWPGSGLRPLAQGRRQDDEDRHGVRGGAGSQASWGAACGDLGFSARHRGLQPRFGWRIISTRLTNPSLSSRLNHIRACPPLVDVGRGLSCGCDCEVKARGYDIVKILKRLSLPRAQLLHPAGNGIHSYFRNPGFDQRKNAIIRELSALKTLDSGQQFILDHYCRGFLERRLFIIE